MRTKLIPFSITLLILAALAAGRHLLIGEEKAAAPIKLRGTVVDMHCYVTHGIHDADHTACANSCIARGLPAGFLADDGTLYVLFGDKPQSVKDQVKDLADVPATLTGVPVVRSGVKGIQIESIEKQKP